MIARRRSRQILCRQQHEEGEDQIRAGEQIAVARVERTAPASDDSAGAHVGSTQIGAQSGSPEAIYE